DHNAWQRPGDPPRRAGPRAPHLDEMPHAEEYETLAGFLMVMLRRVPKRTDNVSWGGYTFEVMDVDSYRIDQVMVTKGSGIAKAPAN
ncbi:transporter associated domain-containing protein, partial [Variovorax sp. tm]|uniref:transporter associated domain-containing protein n=1 Tax=Variovorax atrisoli TaxID=3394203 RepID=UPI003A80BCC2